MKWLGHQWGPVQLAVVHVGSTALALVLLTALVVLGGALLGRNDGPAIVAFGFLVWLILLGPFAVALWTSTLLEPNTLRYTAGAVTAVALCASGAAVVQMPSWYLARHGVEVTALVTDKRCGAVEMPDGCGYEYRLVDASTERHLGWHDWTDMCKRPPEPGSSLLVRTDPAGWFETRPTTCVPAAYTPWAVAIAGILAVGVLLLRTGYHVVPAVRRRQGPNGRRGHIGHS
jgi:hypothetical protein